MSPSESQLRAALREGEKGGIDAGVIIANAERYRRARRQRVTYAAVAVVVAAFVGVGGTLLAGSGSSDETAGGSAGTAAAGGGAAYRNMSKRPGASSAAPSRATGGLGPASGVATCPSTPARLSAAGAGRRHGGQLLPAGVSSITACGYPAARTSGAQRRADRAPGQTCGSDVERRRDRAGRTRRPVCRRRRPHRRARE